MKFELAPRWTIRYELMAEDDFLIHQAITKACDIHKLPASVRVSEFQTIDPWNRVLEIGMLCRSQNVSLALNRTTIIGQSITGGDKSEFWQKAMPLLFELVCLKVWPQMKLKSGPSQDIFVGKHSVDCKCKHRERPPESGWVDYIATVPVSQRNQSTEFYCFGQMSKGMRVGYIIGVMSKKDFTEAVMANKQTKGRGEVDSNGEKYVDPVDYVKLDELFNWQEETLRGFFPLKYLLEYKSPVSGV